MISTKAPPTRFLVTCVVDGIGKRQHVISAETAGAAYDRFQRAYAGRSCVHVITRPMIKTENEA